MNQSYNILEITPGADWEKIKKAWKKQALKWHPDKNLNNKEVAEQKLKEVNNAFEQLYKEKFGNDEEEEIFESGFVDPQDMLDELFAEAGLGDYESWKSYFSGFVKQNTIENIKIQMIGIENEVNADPNFWSQFGRDWEEKIKQMDDSSEIISFQREMLEALKEITEAKLAKERANHDEFMENSDKGLKFIKKHLKSKNLSNADLNSYIKRSSPALMKVGNKMWHEEHVNWGHENSINTYTSIIDNCANEKQRTLDKQRVDWKKKSRGDDYLRAVAIAEINDQWGAEITINGKKIEDYLGRDWKSQINKRSGSEIKDKKDQFNKMISELKNINSNQEKPTNYLPWILGGIGIFAFIVLIIYLATRPSKK